MATVRLDKGHRTRSARERLQSDRAGTGEEVKEVAARDFELDDVEDGFADAVLSRTDRVRLRHLEVAPSELAACDPHFFRAFFCRAKSFLRPFFARSIIAARSWSENALCSAQPWSSTNRPLSVMMTLRSTSAVESWM